MLVLNANYLSDTKAIKLKLKYRVETSGTIKFFLRLSVYQALTVL